jgi:ABC-2 type transport system permease protein
MSDIGTMLWKEWKDFLWSGGRSDLYRPMLIIVILGVVLPLTLKERWLTHDSAPILIILYIPFMLIISFIGDAIAGERERHTLETLLASRISDRAILLGKILVTVGFSWGLTLICLLVGAVVVNLSIGAGPWAFYTPINLFVVILILNFLTSLLAASGGVLISLKSATVRQASQTMILAMIVLGLAVYGITRFMPASVTASLTTSQLVQLIMAVLAALDAVLVAASLVSFQRSRLILS